MSEDGRIGDRYGLVRQIGSGALGPVWEAEDTATGARVAVKVLSLPPREVGEKLAAEARAAQNASHATLVSILDVGTSRSGEPFVAMELLGGETLADRLARERSLVPHLAAQIGRDIALALTTAHAARLVHGDVRPANVFLQGDPGTEDPQVKLLDLWVARAIPAEVADSLGLSAPSYRSPEQLEAPELLDVRSDLWSLGVVLFEMLAGQRPFEGSRTDVTSKITSGPVPRVTQYVSAVDPALEEIVARCMERERDKRIGSAMVVSHMLEVFAAAGRKAADEQRARELEEEEEDGIATLHMDSSSAIMPRGQLGTLVMAESAPDLPLPSSSSKAGPLGTLVMSPGEPEPPPRRRLERPDLTPLPRDPEPTQVFVDETASGFGVPPPMATAEAHANRPPHAAFATMQSARQPQMTVTEMHPQPAAPAAGFDNGKVLAIAVGVAIVVLIGLFVVFVLV